MTSGKCGASHSITFSLYFFLTECILYCIVVCSMRAIKSLLVTAGALRRNYPSLSEDELLIRAMLDSNVPKFLSFDLPLFNAIVTDLFPGVPRNPSDYGELSVAVENCIKAEGLQLVESFKNKVLQLADTFNVRFGVMIVGLANSGKSTIHQILKKSKNLLHEKYTNSQRYPQVHSDILNPKCISMGELYGEMNGLTAEFKEGLGSSIMRAANADNSGAHHWIVFDGPVDALWIENMNTVLDDNQTLCLVSGERMKLSNNMRMLFEVEDLKVASPATVSRCGMVYISNTDLPLLPRAKAWLHNNDKLNQLSNQLNVYILSLFESKLLPAIEFIRSHCSECIVTLDSNLVNSFCNLFQAVLSSQDNSIDLKESFDDVRVLVDLIFAFSLTWSVGGGLDSSSQKLFNRWLMENFVNCRPANSFYESFVDCKEKNWRSWDSLTPAFEYNSKLPYFQLLVPTIDTVRYQYLLAQLVAIHQPIFFTGSTGVGKTVIINDFCKNTDNEAKYLTINLSFSAATDSKKTQEIIESKLTKYRKTLLGAPAHKHAIIVIDDVNMPTPELFGATPPIELLRQMLDYEGVYDRQQFYWKSIIDTNIIVAAAPPEGGRHHLTNRFMRHFNLFAIPNPAEATLKKIFSSILTGFLANFKPAVQKYRDSLVNSTVELYDSIAASLLPTPNKSHYLFNLRDISKVFQGILMIKPSAVTHAEGIIKLWLHEAQRCFADRLVNNSDKHWLQKKLHSLLGKYFQVNWNYGELFEVEGLSGKILFGDWFRPGAEKLYELYNPAITNNRSLSSMLDDYQEEFNLDIKNNRKTELVFFNDAIEHLARIIRILKQPKGHALLVGVGGSGRQSLTRLAAQISEMKCFEIEITRNYGYNEFRESLKRVMYLAGVQGINTIFLLTDNNIIEERFLEDINSILNNSEVANLYEPEEMVKLMEELTPIIREQQHNNNKPASNTSNVYSAFIDRIRDHLHIVLCFSPVGDTFRSRCRAFPSLINCTTIDWFNEWPESALLAVANRLLRALPLPSEGIRSSLQELFVYVQQTVIREARLFSQQHRRIVYITPKSYLESIVLYQKLLTDTRADITAQRNRLLTGLTKLAETKTIVNELQETLQKLKPILIEKTRETEELLARVESDQAKADSVRAVVEVEEKDVATRTAEVRDIQADAQADLDLAMPALRAAVRSLEKLKKAEISEVKSMTSPPIGNQISSIIIFSAACSLLHTNPFDSIICVIV
jgi:dynein heavy chain